MPDRCPNCDAPAPFEALYCAQCGQRLQVALRLGDALGEVLGSITSLELPFLRTFVDLLRSPGETAAAWIKGQRRRYTHPIKFAMIIGVIVALTYEPLIRLSEPSTGVASYGASLARHFPQYFGFFVVIVVAPIGWALAPIAALCGTRRPWLEWYVLGVYSWAFGCAIQLFHRLLQRGLELPSNQWIEAAIGLLPVFLLCWGAWGLARGQRRIGAVVAAFLAQALLIAVVVAFLQ